MNNSIKDYHRKPTYDELIQEAIIHPTDIIKYPNRIATQLRNTPQLTRFDDEIFLDTNILNSNAMKQNLQQTALQKATQPVARYIKTGLEQFDIHDTDETIQQQADDNTADLEDLHATKKKKDETIRDRFEDALSDPTQIDEMIKSTGNLRGSSSASSATPPEDYKPDETKAASSKSKGNLRGSSSSAAAIPEEEEEDEFNYKPSEIITNINLAEKATNHLNLLKTKIKQNMKNGSGLIANDLIAEQFEINKILKELRELTNKKYKKNKTPQAIEDRHLLEEHLNKLLNKSKWQIAGLPTLSDKEGLDRAYNNNENLYYDGNEKLYIAGTNSIKDLVINDLTIPFRGLIQYTDRYKKAHQLYTDNKDKIKTIVSHSLGSVLAHHIILENEQVKGRLYSTPSLAIPHDRISYFSHYGDPIAMFNLDTTNRKLYLGNPHTYIGY